jgi:hypothetical protein
MALHRVFDPEDHYYLDLDMHTLDSDLFALLVRWVFARVASPKLASAVHSLVRKKIFPEMVKRLLSEPERVDLLPTFAIGFLSLFGYLDSMKIAVDIELIAPACHRLGRETQIDDLSVILANRVWFGSKGMCLFFSTHMLVKCKFAFTQILDVM